ncbi:MAG: efflux RND transporter periplasmic adaptor subunit [Pirellulaceae bacterium]
MASSARPVELRVRDDLQFAPLDFQQRRCWTVKDPLRLKYFRFEAEEYALLRMFDGRISWEELKSRFDAEFAPQRITISELQRFAGHAHRQHLLVADGHGQGGVLLERRRDFRRRAFWNTVLNPLAIRLPLFSSERVLKSLTDTLGWLFSRTAVLVAVLWMFAALLLVGSQWDDFQMRLPAFRQFFALHNWGWLAATLALTKVLHEIGHAVACRRFGGKCNEMGVMLLVFTPCLYCNVTDAWMLPDKRRRMAISAAGMYVELLLAAVATFVWWFTHPCLVHYLALNIMCVSGISTVLFNANPLLRYDGYYILSDWLEIPNLQRHAATVVGRWWRQLSLGIVDASEPFSPKHGHAWFAAYALASFVYRWIVAVAILWLLYHMLEPYGLQVLGRILMFLVVMGMVIQPLRRLVAFAKSPHMLRQVKFSRFAAFMGAAGLLLAVVCCVPLPYRTEATVRVEPRAAANVYVEIPGRLAVIHVRPGDVVEAGQPLVSLENDELRRVADELADEHARLAVRARSLRQLAFRDEAAQQELQSLEKAAEALEEQLALRRADLARLELVAPTDGLVVAAERRPSTNTRANALGSSSEFSPAAATGSLDRWSNQPLDRRNHGARLETGTIVCRIANPRDLEAVLSIDERDRPLVARGQTVDLFLTATPGRKQRVSIEHIAQQDGEFTPASYIPSRTPSSASFHRSADSSTAGRIFQASCPLQDDADTIRVGATGRAKIHVGYRTLAWRLWRTALQTIRFD